MSADAKNNSKNTQTNNPPGTLQKKSDVGPTSDQPFNELDKYNLSPANDHLDFKINSFIKEKYRKLSPGKKKIVKLLLQAAIFSLADDKENLQEITKELGAEMMKQNMQPILNINVNVNEPKAINKVNIDISKLLDVLNELERLIITIKKYSWDPKRNAFVIPATRIQDLSELINKTKKLIN